MRTSPLLWSIQPTFCNASVSAARSSANAFARSAARSAPSAGGVVYCRVFQTNAAKIRHTITTAVVMEMLRLQQLFSRSEEEFISAILSNEPVRRTRHQFDPVLHRKSASAQDDTIPSLR